MKKHYRNFNKQEHKALFHFIGKEVEESMITENLKGTDPKVLYENLCSPVTKIYKKTKPINISGVLNEN